MKKMKKTNWLLLLYWTLIVLLIIFLLINVFWVVYAFIKYGNKPITEIPGWAIWYMLGRGR